MTIYAWPATWLPSRFEMRILPNTRTFVGPYTPTTQIIDLLGERWTMSFDLPQDSDPILGAAREAFFDRLKGPANQIALSNLIRPQPQGTLRDTAGGNAQWKTGAGANATWQTSVPSAATWTYAGATTAYVMPQLSNMLPIATTPGATLLAGDHIGCAGQLFRAMANATADGTGLLLVEVQPRARNAIATGTGVTCTAPTANFMLKAEGVPTVWRVGRYDGATLDLIEVF